MLRFHLQLKLETKLARVGQWTEWHMARHMHDTYQYSTARHEHVLVGHVARHDKKACNKHVLFFLMKVKLKFYDFTNNLKLKFLNSFNS